MSPYDADLLDIRSAQISDAPAITALLHELGYPSNAEAEVTERLAQWSDRDDVLVLVAAAGQPVVGISALNVIPHFVQPGSWGRVAALAVAADLRGRGIGRRLLAATEQAALDRGCVRMEINSSRRRTGAHAFYQSLGYTDFCEEAARFVKP
jgi:GNAT superfamily N-acetyltransferase